MSNQLAIVSLADATPIAPAFLLPGLLPRAAITTILSSPGTGRTTLALQLASLLPPNPSSTSPTIFFISPLANPALEFRPRLAQLGASLPNLRFILGQHPQGSSALPSTRNNPFTIHDLPLLEQSLSASPEVRLLVIDNPELFFDLPQRPDPRTLTRHLYALNDLARRKQLAILLLPVLPPTQRPTPNPFSQSRFLQSLADASKLTYLLTPAPSPSSFCFSAFSTFDSSTPPHSLLFPLKNTLPFTPTTRLIPALPTPDPLRRTPLPNHCALQEIPLTYAQYLAHSQPQPRSKSKPDTSLHEAIQFLKEELKSGPLPASTLKHRANQATLPWRTIQLAKQHLQIPSLKSKYGPWHWHLPNTPSSVGPNDADVRAGSVSDGISNSPLTPLPDHCALPPLTAPLPAP